MNTQVNGTLLAVSFIKNVSEIPLCSSGTFFATCDVAFHTLTEEPATAFETVAVNGFML